MLQRFQHHGEQLFCWQYFAIFYAAFMLQFSSATFMLQFSDHANGGDSPKGGRAFDHIPRFDDSGVHVDKYPIHSFCNSQAVVVNEL